MMARRSELAIERNAVLSDMQRDVDLGFHSVPGETLDTIGQRDAEAYVQRVRDRWRERNARIARELADIDASLAAGGCRSP